MNFNFLEIETAKTNKTIKILIILIILVFIIIIGLFIMMFLQVKGINVSFPFNNKREQAIDVSAQLDENITLSQQEIKDDESNKNLYLPNMDKETLGKINKIYNQGDSEHKIAYLTFDDGPSKKITPQILDILKEYDIKATFFVLGSNIKYNPDILKRVYEEGHYIANHSYTHEYEKIYDKKENVLEEYNKTEEAIRQAIGVAEYSSGLFRFPGGSVGGQYEQTKKKAKKLLEQNNVATLDWNALNGDAEYGTKKSDMLKTVEETIEGQDCVVILMHDSSDKQNTVDTLPKIIEYLKEEGYEFKNIYDMMKKDL